jgi:TrbC/VIRB2 pilin
MVVLGRVRRPEALRMVYAGIVMAAMVAVAPPAFAHAAGPFAGLITIITAFKEALLAAAVALVVIGLIGAGFAYLNRTQEGIGGVFYGFVVIVIIGALIFGADAIVAAIPNATGALV